MIKEEAEIGKVTEKVRLTNLFDSSKLVVMRLLIQGHFDIKRALHYLVLIDRAAFIGYGYHAQAGSKKF